METQHNDNDNDANIKKVTDFGNDIYIINDMLDSTFCKNMCNHINEQALNKNDQYLNGSNVLSYNININELCMDNILIKQDISLLLTGYVRAIASVINNIRPHVFSNQIPNISMVQLRRIFGETRHHIDNITPTSIRHLTCIIILNNDYDDGVFSFPSQNLEFKVKQGDVVLFPPFWTHPHKVSCPSNGFRYTINYWYVDSTATDSISIS